jgi:hypothetical protein
VSAYRNLLRVRVPVSLLAQFIAQSAWTQFFCDEPVPLPNDAQYVRAWYDPETDSFALVFEHPSFLPTYEGGHPMSVQVTALTPLPIAGALTTGTGDET